MRDPNAPDNISTYDGIWALSGCHDCTAWRPPDNRKGRKACLRKVAVDGKHPNPEFSCSRWEPRDES